jgi:hypothetical protein
VAELAVRLPAGSQLLLASRRMPPLPVALLRAQGQMAEIGADQLAMGEQEARALLEGAGIGLADADLTEVRRRTEGWPVGLYLAALAVKLGSRAIWHKGWKAVIALPAAPGGWPDHMQDRWELYDTTKDPTELHDLADQHPGKLQELIALWFYEAGRYNGLPIESRTAVEILTTPRPEVGKPRDRYAYYPDCAEVPEAAAVVPQGRQAQVRLQLRRDRRADGRL